MNRKLHHSLSAIAVSAAFLLLSMAAAFPGASSTGPASAVATAQAQVDSILPTPVIARAGTSPRRQRHRLVMPYFSFSSRS